MKKIILSIIAALFGVGILTGTGFYVVPKFIQKTPTKWTDFIDKVWSWITTNWVWCIVIALAVITVIVAFRLALVEKRR